MSDTEYVPRRKNRIPRGLKLPSLIGMVTTGIPLGQIEVDVRKFCVYLAVQNCGGNHSQAADHLGIHRNTVTRIMRDDR